MSIIEIKTDLLIIDMTLVSKDIRKDMPQLLDTVGTPTPYSTLDLEREDVHFESIPAQNHTTLAIKQQKPPRELEPQDLWESSSPTKIAKPKRCYRMNRRFCLQELKNARAIWFLFGRNSLRAQT